MTVQASSRVTDVDRIDLDAPIFDPDAFRLTDETAAIIATARALGQNVFAGRAAAYDREAKFPTDNYRDLHRAGLLGIAIPKKYGGLGADYQTYAVAAAEIGRYCGATALTWNMHVCSTLWSGPLADDLEMDAATRAEHERRRAVHYKRIVNDGAIYSQPFSEGGAAAAGGIAFGTEAKPIKGGWIVNGKKIFASLSGHADYYGVLCTEVAEGEKASRRDTLYLALPASTEGVSVVGDWDPLGMRGTVSRTLLFKDVFVAEDAALMPRGVYFQAAMRWPHMFLTLSPTYIGLAQAAYDFTVRYLRGEVPGTPPVKRRMYPTKQIAVAQMQIKLEQIKAIWFQAITEARANPTKEQVLRAYAAQYSAMEGANEIATLAIRTCGRPGDAEITGTRARVSRQPLRFAHAAVDCRALPRPHRPRSAVRDRRGGRLVRMDLSHLIARNAAFTPDKPATIFEGEILSYARFSAHVEQTAHALKADFGVSRGDRVAILSLNRPECQTSFIF
jgi:alkylation response protein AidB-like acyl-CoA dehydrogenase